jgi:hypothetical protein
MVYKESDHFIRGIDEYDANYELAHVIDVIFLTKVMYCYDLTLYNLYEECLVKTDFLAIQWELADLQQCHTKVLSGHFFQTLPHILKAPTHNRKKRNITAVDDMDKPNPALVKNPKDPHLPNKEQHPSLQLQPSDNFNNVVLRTQQMKLVPNFPGTKTSICVNWHASGRCHRNCAS